jgi:hypothetical protein
MPLVVEQGFLSVSLVFPCQSYSTIAPDSSVISPEAAGSADQAAHYHIIGL